MISHLFTVSDVAIYAMFVAGWGLLYGIAWIVSRFTR